MCSTNMDLFITIQYDDSKKLRRLLEKGANPNAIDNKNKQNRPLHFAIEMNNEDMVRELLVPKWKVDINAQNIYGDTPLHVAALEGHDRFIHLLWECHAISNIPNQQGKTFLDVIRRYPLGKKKNIQENFCEVQNSSSGKS